MITKENYSKILTDVATFDEQNIRYIKPHLFYKVARNMGIYYKVDDIKQKIIFETPLMTVPFDISAFENDNSTFYNMSLSFTNLPKLYNEDDVKQFLGFIKRIDDITTSTIQGNVKRWKLPKDIQFQKTLKRINSDQPHFMNVSIPYCNDDGVLVRCLDSECNVVPLIKTIKKRSVVKAIVELTDVVFTRDKYWLNYTLLQIRKHKPYSEIRNFFLNVSVLGDTKPVTQTRQHEIPQPPPQPNIPVMPKIVIPTADQLKNARKNLKTTSD